MKIKGLTITTDAAFCMFLDSGQIEMKFTKLWMLSILSLVWLEFCVALHEKRSHAYESKKCIWCMFHR